MSVECDCGEPVGNSQTFCRRCGARVDSRKGTEDLTRRLGRSQPGRVAHPGHRESQRAYPPSPEHRKGPDLKVIAGGLVVVLALAAGGFALATVASDGEGGGNSTPSGDANSLESRDRNSDQGGGSGEVSGEDNEDTNRGFSESPDQDGQVPPIPPFRQDCGNGVYAAGSASCVFSRNIAAQYRDSPSPVLYDVYSPETKIAYDVECVEAGYVTCEGGVNATVFFYPNGQG